MTPSRSARGDVTRLRHLLGQLEDQAAAAGWTWDAAVSMRVDALLLALEVQRA